MTEDSLLKRPTEADSEQNLASATPAPEAVDSSAVPKLKAKKLKKHKAKLKAPKDAAGPKSIDIKKPEAPQVVVEALAANAEETQSSPISTEVVSQEVSPASSISKKNKFSGKLAKTPKKVWVPSLIFSVLLICFFVFPNLIYKGKILPKTYFNGQQLSSNPAVAKDQIQNSVNSYQVKLKKDDQSKDYKPEDLGIKIDAEQIMQAAQNSSNQVRFFARPFAVFSKREVGNIFSTDELKLKQFLKDNYADGQVAQDAKIEYSKEARQFVVIADVAGKGVDSSKLLIELNSKLSSFSQDPIAIDITNISPDITASNLEESLARANYALSLNLQIKGPIKSLTVPKDILQSWLILRPDFAGKSYSVSINKDAASAYAQKAIESNSRKMEKRTVANIDSGQIVLSEGQSGINVTNADQAKNSFVSSATSLKNVAVNLETAESAPETEDVAASNGRWIFADLSQFKLSAYEGATMVNSFPMSSGAPATPTPPGSYSVMSKVRVKTMRGGTPGTRDYYEVPNIEWVAYFKSGGYAMHGVYWHNNFGIKNTSHGCMGLSNTNANWVYNFVEVGTPVIIVP
jgi:lipoprotein-anchoring transpeptidase ErfK/SrfK